jgi:hypothetical protein
MKDYVCDNFENEKCMCHKSKSGCVNLSVDKIIEQIRAVSKTIDLHDIDYFYLSIKRKIQEIRQQ